MNQSYKDWCQHVKDIARNDWPRILQVLAGLSYLQTDSNKSRRKGAPCPNPECPINRNNPIPGGIDRYSFKDPDTGGWACRRCGGGDGWKMLMLVNSWDFAHAVREVADYLRIEPYNGQAPDPQQREAAKQRAEQRQKAHKAHLEQEQRKQAAIYDQRAAYALKEWNQAIPAGADHPHLVRKDLPPFNLREIDHQKFGARCLLVPLFNEAGQLRNLERIPLEGNKQGIAGAQKKGLFYQFGKPTWTIYTCEGWSTGAAIHLDKPNHPCVLAAMGSGNLQFVTEIALRRFPDSVIVIAADHDQPGIEAAVSVATKHDLKIVIPEQPGMDFCDLHVMQEG